MPATGNRLKELRKAAEPAVELYDIAAHLRVSVDTVRRWDEQQRFIPTKHLIPLAELLAVTTDHLLGLDRETEKEAA